MENNVPFLQLHGLLLSVITEVKHGQPIHKSAIQAKRRVKQMLHIPKNTPNDELIIRMGIIYADNKMFPKFLTTLGKFELHELANQSIDTLEMNGIEYEIS